jgi:hypothetical protein
MVPDSPYSNKLRPFDLVLLRTSLTAADPRPDTCPFRYAHYDGNPSFSDFTPFAGWTTPLAKQYQGTTTNGCGASVDYNIAIW